MLTYSNMGGGSSELNCNKNKGFTLIELLAVIVILAIIAVIATPIITGIIEDSKKASFERSAEGVVEATKFDIPEKLTEAGYTYEFENGEIDLGENVKVNNAKNLSGTIKYNKDGEVSYAIHNDKWCVIKNNNETTTTAYEEGKCVLETSTIASAFTYMDNIESFEVGDNCVSYFQTDFGEEAATTFCSGGELGGLTLKEYASSKIVDVLKTNNVIKNVVTSSSEITITDYNIVIGGIDVVIPSTIDGKTVVAIGPNAFASKTLSTETSMLNKNNIQFMSNKEDNEIAAISGPIGNIRSVVIPSTVKSIEEDAFYFNQISSVTLSNGLETIGKNAFSTNQLVNIIIPSSVTSIGEYAFATNQLTSVTIPKSVTSIGKSAFDSNQISSVTLSNGLETIGKRAFAVNQITTITIPKSVTSIGDSAFATNQITTITIPKSVTSIGRLAFAYNQLTSVIIESSEIRIGCMAFESNKNLTSIKIAGVDTSIDEIHCVNA